MSASQNLGSRSEGAKILKSEGQSVYASSADWRVKWPKPGDDKNESSFAL